jgi:hypothetical protein
MTDLHKMRYWSGECDFDRMKFEVLPHALRVYRPDRSCPGRHQPQMDFSRGFPVPWKYSFTDISVPSQHELEGRRYAAEVILAHTYSARIETKLVRSTRLLSICCCWVYIHRLDRAFTTLTHPHTHCLLISKIGNLSILLQEGGPNDRYDFLDLHIQGWVEAAKKVIDKCNSRRRLTELDDTAAELDAALEAVGYFALNVTTTTTEERRSLFPLHDPKFHRDPTQPRAVQKPWYDRTWHPYDWYIKANTEVRCTVCRCSSWPNQAAASLTSLLFPIWSLTSMRMSTTHLPSITAHSTNQPNQPPITSVYSTTFATKAPCPNHPVSKACIGGCLRSRFGWRRSNSAPSNNC